MPGRKAWKTHWTNHSLTFMAFRGIQKWSETDFTVLHLRCCYLSFTKIHNAGQNKPSLHQHSFLLATSICWATVMLVSRRYRSNKIVTNCTKVNTGANESLFVRAVDLSLSRLHFPKQFAAHSLEHYIFKRLHCKLHSLWLHSSKSLKGCVV